MLGSGFRAEGMSQNIGSATESLVGASSILLYKGFRFRVWGNMDPCESITGGQPIAGTLHVRSSEMHVEQLVPDARCSLRAVMTKDQNSILKAAPSLSKLGQKGNIRGL